MRLARSFRATAGVLLALCLFMETGEAFHFPVGRHQGLSAANRRLNEREEALLLQRAPGFATGISSALVRPSSMPDRGTDQRSYSSDDRPRPNGGGYNQNRGENSYQPREGGNFPPRDGGNFQPREGGNFPPREGGYQNRNQGGNFQPREGGNGYQNRNSGGYQGNGGQGGYSGPRRPNNNNWGNNRSNNMGGSGPSVLLTGAKLLVRADKPRPERERRDTGPRTYEPRGGDGGGGRFQPRGPGGNDRGGGDRFQPRGPGGMDSRGGDRFQPRGGPGGDSRGMGRGRFDGPVGLDVPVAVPEVVDTLEARRKKDKEKKDTRSKEFGKKGKGGKRFDNDDFEGVADLEMRYGKKRRGQKGKGVEMRQGPKVVVIDEATITIQQLSEKMDVRAGEVIKYLMVNLGVMATITQSIDAETAVKVADAFGKEIARSGDGNADEEDEHSESVETKGAAWIDDDPSTLKPRAPVVTIMGHVDHGKTSLLDAIRETSVVAGEAGGITQHIGAYQVQCNGKPITFIDTPGHAAFSEMRARGANVTDMVVLVVAADEGVKEQTVEAIKCAKQAGVPVLVAVNKVDKPGADIQRVSNELMKYDLLMEEYGGEVLSAGVSAKKRIGLDELLEKILLQAEVLDLKANPDRAAQGTVVDARMEKGLGPVTTVLVQRGTLKVGDCIVAGQAYGKVRSLTDERGSRIDSAGPSSPAVVSGWDGVPSAGDLITVVGSEVIARQAAEARRKLARERTGVEMSRSMQAQVLSIFGPDGTTTKERKELTVVIKADVQGSAEALATALNALKAEDDRCEVVVKVLQSGVGDVTQSDVSLASVSKATIIAFNVAADNPAMEESRKTMLPIEYYSVIYDVIDKIDDMLKQILSPTPDGEFAGSAIIKQVFEIGKVGKVAGCEITEGYVRRGGVVRILRGTEILFRGGLKTLRSVKSDVTEMRQGQDCGMSFAGFEDFLEGDVIECYIVDKKKAD